MNQQTIPNKNQTSSIAEDQHEQESSNTGNRREKERNSQMTFNDKAYGGDRTV